MQRVLLIFVIFLSSNFGLNNAVVFKLTNIECASYNQSWFLIHNCRLRVMQRNRIGLYFNGTVLYPANDITLNLQLFKRANGYKPWLMKALVDICRYMKKPYNPAAKMLINMVLPFTNFNHKCPFNGSQIVDGLYLQPELLPLPFPTGDFKLYFGWHFNKRLQFETNASFTFVENLIDQ